MCVYFFTILFRFKNCLYGQKLVMMGGLEKYTCFRSLVSYNIEETQPLAKKLASPQLGRSTNKLQTCLGPSNNACQSSARDQGLNGGKGWGKIGTTTNEEAWMWLALLYVRIPERSTRGGWSNLQYTIDQRSYRQIHKDFIHQIKIVIRASRKKFRFFLSSVVLFRYP